MKGERTLFPAWTDMDKAQNVFGLIESYAYDVIMMWANSPKSNVSWCSEENGHKIYKKGMENILHIFETPIYVAK